MIKQAVQKAESRLRDEQKSVKNQKRIVRVQELMSSEEEKRKTKQKAVCGKMKIKEIKTSNFNNIFYQKLEHKQSKLKQQASLQANNGRISLIATTSGSIPEYADVASGATVGSSSTIIFQRCDTMGATLADTSPDHREPMFKCKFLSTIIRAI